MSCAHPTKIRNPINGQPMSVGCGKCFNCRLERSIDWRVRIAMEKYTQRSYGCTFATLTYSDLFLPSDYSCRIEEVQKLMKRFRYFSKDNKYLSPTFKHFSVSEYGDESARPHYHSILMGVNVNTAASLLRKSWKYGFIKTLPLTPYRIRYVVDYVTIYDPPSDTKDQYRLEGLEPPTRVFSQGIGYQYMYDFEDEFNRDGFYLVQGVKWTPSPYWKAKLGLSYDPVPALKATQSQLTQLGFDPKSQKDAIKYAQVKEGSLYAKQKLKGLPSAYIPSSDKFMPDDKIKSLADSITFFGSMEEPPF